MTSKTWSSSITTMQPTAPTFADAEMPPRTRAALIGSVFGPGWVERLHLQHDVPAILRLPEPQVELADLGQAIQSARRRVVGRIVRTLGHARHNMVFDERAAESVNA
jgi:hypothetical protein